MYVSSLASGTNTTVYMYYNNTGASNQQNVANVWANGWANGNSSVWHLKEVGTGNPTDYNDSSMNGNNGWAGGGTAGDFPTQTTGIIGYGQSLDGVNDYIATNKTVFSAPTAFTESVWFNTATAASGEVIGLENNQKGTGSNALDWNIYIANNGAVQAGIWSGGFSSITTYPTKFNNSIWHYAVLTWGATTLSLYVDGSLIGSKTGVTPQTMTGISGRVHIISLAIGKMQQVEITVGYLTRREFQQASRVHPARISTQYQNQKNPALFLYPMAQETWI